LASFHFNLVIIIIISKIANRFMNHFCFILFLWCKNIAAAAFAGTTATATREENANHHTE